MDKGDDIISINLSSDTFLTKSVILVAGSTERKVDKNEDFQL